PIGPHTRATANTSCVGRDRPQVCSAARRRFHPRPGAERSPIAEAESFSRVDSGRQKAAIHHDALPRNKARGFRSEQNGGAHQLFRFAETAHGSAEQNLASTLGPI